MKIWEYMVATYPNAPVDSLVKAMNDAGGGGWEVFKMIEGPKFVVVWFKKPREQ